MPPGGRADHELDFYPVIPAGGSGKRLWPLSRVEEPKFLKPIAGPGSNLFVQTVERLSAVAPTRNIYVVTGERYAPRILEEAPGIAPGNVLAEPGPMDSGPAIALASAIIDRRHPGSLMGTFAADHFIPDPEGFASAVRTALAGAARGLLMTIGVEPTRPDTGYGYVHLDASTGAEGIFSVKRFKEKPDFALATEFLASGEYLWNASTFVWRPDVFLEELRLEDPGMHEGVSRLAEAWDTPSRPALLAEIWPTLTRIAVEYLVMEPASARGRVGTVRGGFPWTDVGDFNTLGEINGTDASGNSVVGAEPVARRVLSTGAELAEAADAAVLLQDSENLVVHPSAGKFVAAIGVQDIAIIETADALLVCARDRVQDVKALVDALGEIPRPELL
jgi:mannose-1-phosphate guanylyltransferase